MGSTAYPSTASPIKSIQSGTASSAGTISIAAVNVAKTIVHSVSTGSAGQAAVTGVINAANGSTSGTSTSGMSAYLTIANANPYTYYGGNAGGGSFYSGGRYSVYTGVPGSAYYNGMNANGANVGLNATSISAGSTSLTVANYGALLTNSTTLTITGPCTYQVVEYY